MGRFDLCAEDGLRRPVYLGAYERGSEFLGVVRETAPHFGPTGKGGAVQHRGKRGVVKAADHARCDTAVAEPALVRGPLKPEHGVARQRLHRRDANFGPAKVEDVSMLLRG